MAANPPTKSPAAPPANPAETKPVENKSMENKPAEEKQPGNKFDRFHPGMPSIPGVIKASPKKARGSSSMDTQLLLQIGGIALGVVFIGVVIYWWAISRPRTAAKPSADSDAAEQVTPTPPPSPVAAVPDGPTVAASVDELSKPWDGKKFTYANSLTHEYIDAMVIRLPGGTLWGFSLQVPFARCELEYVTDLGKIASQYKYRASHPMVVSPCDNTVYDPLKVGNLGGDTLARGEIVQGGALRPPLSIDVKVSGTSVIADGIEQ